MDDPATPRPSALTKVLATAKRFAYSGLARERWQHPRRVMALLGITDGNRVLDLGAGAGYFSVKLARAVGETGRVYAVEPDDDMRWMIEREATRRGLGNVVTMTADDDAPELPEPVDVVLVVNAFHHLPDPGVVMAGLVGQLRPGGRLAVIEPQPRWYLFGHATEPEVIRSTLVDTGFSIADEHDLLPRQSFIVAEPR